LRSSQVGAVPGAVAARACVDRGDAPAWGVAL